jgi:hypothetical protein
MSEVTLEKIGPANLAHCGIGCVTNPGHQGHQPKVEWLRNRFAEGLRILLFRSETGKPLAFLEYVAGEYAWRPVDAKGWMFVHCLWVYPKGQQIGGLGTRLIEACLEEARAAGVTGVAALVSDGPWMAGKEVFVRCGFMQAAEEGRFQLMTFRFKRGRAPTFRNISENAAKYQGLHVIYSPQCPYLPKSVNDISELAAAHGLKLEVTELSSAAAAQNAPSYYGVFSLVWNGRVLADHYVSQGRFRNILRKVILKDLRGDQRPVRPSQKRRTGGRT